ARSRRNRGPADQRQERLGQPNGGLEVELHVALEVGPAGIAEPPAPGPTRVVDEQVELAVLALDYLPDGFRRFRGSEVERQHRGAAQLLGERAQPLLPARHQHQLGAWLASKPAGGRLPDPARGARDQRYECFAQGAEAYSHP